MSKPRAIEAYRQNPAARRGVKDYRAQHGGSVRDAIHTCLIEIPEKRRSFGELLEKPRLWVARKVNEWTERKVIKRELKTSRDPFVDSSRSLITFYNGLSQQGKKYAFRKLEEEFLTVTDESGARINGYATRAITILRVFGNILGAEEVDSSRVIARVNLILDRTSSDETSNYRYVSQVVVESVNFADQFIVGDKTELRAELFRKMATTAIVDEWVVENAIQLGEKEALRERMYRGYFEKFLGIGIGREIIREEIAKGGEAKDKVTASLRGLGKGTIISLLRELAEVEATAGYALEFAAASPIVTQDERKALIEAAGARGYTDVVAGVIDSKLMQKFVIGVLLGSPESVERLVTETAKMHGTEQDYDAFVRNLASFGEEKLKPLLEIWNANQSCVKYLIDIAKITGGNITRSILTAKMIDENEEEEIRRVAGEVLIELDRLEGAEERNAALRRRREAANVIIGKITAGLEHTLTRLMDAIVNSDETAGFSLKGTQEEGGISVEVHFSAEIRRT